MGDIKLTKVVPISECDHDESWLRDLIYDDPSILGLGDLQAVFKERNQPVGGRLDLLLKDPSDDSMYEVELQLGATDESHIIRTIEYWDNERKKWPKRRHTAVLVAEKITSRFFNVVQLLSLAVPIIGIQANVLQVDEYQALHFAKLIDSYEEPEEDEPIQQTYDEKHWIDNYPGALECARWYKNLLARYYGDISIKYFESYMSMIVGGIARVWVNKRKNDRAFIEVKYVEENLGEAIDYLNKEGVPFSPKGDWGLTFNVNHQQLNEREAVHEWIIQRIAPKFLIKSTKETS